MPDGAKLLYGEITALANKEGYCYARDTYFAELYGKSERTIRNWIEQLEKRGYIHRIHIYKEGTKEIQSRQLSVAGGVVQITSQGARQKAAEIGENNQQKVRKKASEGVEENCQRSGKELPEVWKKTAKYNNTSLIKDIIVHLNQRANKNFKHQAQGNQKFILARLNEGYTLDDFKQVIDNKVADCQAGKFDDKYLRPETLFGNKFDGYLNQKSTQNQHDNNATWMKVLEAIREFGDAYWQEAQTFLGEDVWRAIDQMGGWATITSMTDYNRNAFKNEFDKHYRLK